MMQKPYRFPSRLPRAILWLLGAALFLDIPAARAYNEHKAWTATLGRLLFHGIHEVYKIPLSFTLFEVLSYAMAALILVRWGTQRSRLWLMLSLAAFLVPVACAIGTFTGVLRGNALALAFSQLHFVPMISVWLIIGYYLGTQPAYLLQAVRILFWVCLWRSFYALYVYLVIYGGRMGVREYLIDHASSAFLSTALAYAGFQAYMHKANGGKRLAYIAAFLFMLGPYILNDRRTSFVGFMGALLLVPMILPPRLQLRVRTAFRAVLAVGALLLVYKVVYSKGGPAPSASASGTEAVSIEAIDYRQIENYNLMLGVIERPLLGLGFGTRFPQMVPLPDISFSFDLFDAIPHNTLLYLWTFAGPLAIAALMSSSCLLIVVIARVGRLARDSRELMLAILALFVLVQWGMYVNFDMGLLESRHSMLLGIFAGGLFPVYGRILLEHAYANHPKALSADPPGQPERPAGLRPAFYGQRT